MRIVRWPELIAAPQSNLELLSGQIHVWQASTAVLPGTLTALDRHLSEDEHARAGQFRFQRDRNTYVVARGLLRQLLALYSGEPPAHIRFLYGAQGKPAVANPKLPNLRFNLSHSGGAVLLAFAIHREIGVDIEHMQPDLDFAGLAETVFSTRERNALLQLRPEHRAPLFYEYWTCKEACIKADGRGVSAPLDQFSIVNSAQGSQWREVAVAHPDVFQTAWHLRLLDTISGYAAAVATSGMGWDVVRMALEQEERRETVKGAGQS